MVSPLTTPRLRLQPFTVEDAPLLLELDSDPAVVRYLGPQTPASLDDYRQRIETVYLKYGQTYRSLGFWAIRTQETQAFLGWICLRPASDYRYLREAGFLPEDVELGYRLRQAAWGQGYATEAARAVLTEGFRHESFPRVVASALVPNRGSTRVMEKCGLSRLYEFQIAEIPEPAVVYGITREAWETANFA